MRSTAVVPTSLAVFALAMSGCGVEFLAEKSPVAVANTCQSDTDCGADATCTANACFAKAGVIDEVLLEVTPEANSSSGGLSFLSIQTGIQGGSRDKNIELPSPSPFVAQVLVNGSDLAAECSSMKTGKQTVQARIQFSRTGAVGGVPILGLTNLPVTIDTTLNSGAWNAPISLVPGTYDIYIEPASTSTCPIAPRILRGVDVPEQVVPSLPPATLELPSPKRLNGKVQRTGGGTLVGWHVDIIEPLEGRPISTWTALGPTDGPSPITNFDITYQALTPRTPAAANAPAASGPLIRISPPTAMADTAPTVYWDLAAADLAGDGHCSLDMSGLPRTDQLVDVSGHVTGPSVRANVQFYSLSLAGADGLTASFTKSVMTDELGLYTTQLFPGQYRIVVIPSASGSDTQVVPSSTINGSPTPMGAAARPGAITEFKRSIASDPAQMIDFALATKRSVRGNAFVGNQTTAGATGATLEAFPAILPAEVGALKGALAQSPVLPPNASVQVGNAGTFVLPLDPGDFDLSLRIPESSNFAWWVWPSANVAPDPSGAPIVIDVARLPFPVPLEGVITVPDTTGQPTPLRGAAVRAYAKVPMSTGVTKVGDTRTDDTGRYRLRLPPSFGGLSSFGGP